MSAHCEHSHYEPAEVVIRRLERREKLLQARVTALEQENAALRSILARLVAVVNDRKFESGSEPLRAEEMNEIVAEARAAIAVTEADSP